MSGPGLAAPSRASTRWVLIPPNPMALTAARSGRSVAVALLIGVALWAAYDWVVWRVKQNVWARSDPPIHFRLTRGGGRYYATKDGGPGDCRTVNEALMAILYQEPGWRETFAGNWRQWWDANWTYFPNRELQALPSGPEAPSGRR